MNNPGNQAKEAAYSASEEFKRKASAEADMARETAEAQAGAWSSRVGERASNVAEAVRSASQAARGKEDWFADAADALSENLAQLSQAAQGKSGYELRMEAERLARERPALVMGAAVVAGVALGRLLKSSSHPADSSLDSPSQGAALGRSPGLT
jgi:predicted trehalose synthase